jgi:hypothetical protein
MAHKKKAKKKEPKVKTDLPSLSDIPAFFPAPGLGRLALSNPYLAGALIGYTVAEQTQGIWGPPVEAHARRTRDRFTKDTSTSIDPSSPWIIPEGWGYQAQGPIGPPAPSMRATADQPVKRTRKITKSNKATKKAWDILRKRMKGKMTKEKCQKLLKKCSMISSKANPNTKSRIGKGKTQTCKDARKIRKEIWGTTKRY